MRSFTQNTGWLVLLAAWSLMPSLPAADQTEIIATGLVVVRGAVNGALLERGGKTLAVYGDPREHPPAVDTVLFTHHRRDVAWAGRGLVSAGAKAIVPAAEAAYFAEVGKFWSDFAQKRFHDYSQPTTKVLGEALSVSRAVSGGETLAWEGLPIHVIDTPGFTRGSVAYWIELEGRRIAFTGDLIYGDGRILDLYSLQDAIPEAKIGGYHGYAARLGEVLTSLRKVAAAKPDLIIPARGPVIRNPLEAMETLRVRIQALYANYLSIDALRWYFHDEHILAKAKRMLGPETKVEWMPMADTFNPLPDWLVAIDNSRLLVSSDKSGFLVDCGSRHIIEELKKLQAAGQLSTVEHVFITHYHDDHTDQVPLLVETFGSVVHASPANREVLENPSGHRLPCLTANPIQVSGRAANGAHWRWKEFELTLYYFPGQTLYHDALLVKKDGGASVFFIGDSFTPSGIDDYCLQNRNFLHDQMGFFFCLDLLKRSAPDALLINEHVGPAFWFSAGQIAQMTRVLRQRVELLRSLVPWDDPNYGLDESWARFYPYASQVRPRDQVNLSLRIMNHSPVEQAFQVRPHLPEGWVLRSLSPMPIRLPARSEGAIELRMAVPENAAPGNHLLTADLRFGDWDLREWTEAMVTVAPVN